MITLLMFIGIVLWERHSGRRDTSMGFIFSTMALDAIVEAILFVYVLRSL